MQKAKPKTKRTLDETNNCRRSRGRGYRFEDSLVKRFKAQVNWDARRLGGSSTGLPDIVAMYHRGQRDEIVALEAKSGTGTVLEVPEEQVRRCFTTVDLFQAYTGRCAVFAFKFSRKKRIGKEFERRELREWYVLLSTYVQEKGMIRLNHVWCNYDGKVRIGVDDGDPKPLEDWNYDVVDSFDRLVELLED